MQLHLTIRNEILLKEVLVIFQNGYTLYLAKLIQVFIMYNMLLRHENAQALGKILFNQK